MIIRFSPAECYLVLQVERTDRRILFITPLFLLPMKDLLNPISINLSDTLLVFYWWKLLLFFRVVKSKISLKVFVGISWNILQEQGLAKMSNCFYSLIFPLVPEPY